jgi:hypothetical protein
MSRHDQPFVVEEISFFAALLPIAWLFVLLLGGRLFERIRRVRRPAGRQLLPTPD